MLLTLWSTVSAYGNAARMLSVVLLNVCMTVEMSDQRLCVKQPQLYKCLALETRDVTFESPVYIGNFLVRALRGAA